ncbi:FKBP-type peptidyl-prolyl cis-trans isomerase [uncultured Methanoregula sp.]|uniref:FKBP-type peptidyl-prolyl cis-trans isomerase n=1 Tax=uncultured Methanoregula sp. TaxID=1005933 RepID=UPI002AAAF0CE|nr:FKBP-type peptidyl-prolyl cis-trans isomerase [uncultured Methanoregula sp.]
MKKSEKEKGKEGVAARRKRNRLYTGIVAAVILVVAVVVVGFFLLNSSGARTGDIVSVYYTGTLDDGSVFYSNLNGTPLTFTMGDANLIAGFKEAITGMTPGMTKTIRIPYDKAYGPYRPELVHIVNRSTLPANMNPVAGEYYTIRRTTDGANAYVRIINVTPSTVAWDENHDLAGKDLTYTITVTAVEKK